MLAGRRRRSFVASRTFWRSGIDIRVRCDEPLTLSNRALLVGRTWARVEINTTAAPVARFETP